MIMAAAVFCDTVSAYGGLSIFRCLQTLRVQSMPREWGFVLLFIIETYIHEGSYEQPVKDKNTTFMALCHLEMHISFLLCLASYIFIFWGITLACM